MSGRRVVGCCAHVATVIYYLSYAKYRTVKCPAQHLNSILVNLNSSEKANKPRYVKNKRTKKEYSSSSDSESSNSSIKTTRSTSSSESDCSLSDDESAHEKNNESISGQTSTPQPHSSLTPLLLSSTSQSRSYSSPPTTPILQPQSSPDYLKPKPKPEITLMHQQPTFPIVPVVDDSIPQFTAHKPNWSAIVNFDGRIIKLENTCSIDNYLFALWVLSKIVDFRRMPNLEHTPVLKDIISKIDDLEWDKAREVWVKNIMKWSPGRQNKLCLYGSEFSRFIKYLHEYQRHELIQLCVTSCILNGNTIIRRDSEHIFFKRGPNNTVVLHSKYDEFCEKCGNLVICEINFINKPIWVFVQADSFKLNDLPKYILIKNVRYKFLCATLHKVNHFIGIFEINNNFYIADDLAKGVTFLPPIHQQNSNSRRNKPNYFTICTSNALYYLE